MLRRGRAERLPVAAGGFRGAYPSTRTRSLRTVLATLYRNLGVDPHAMVTDVSGRPTPILPGGVDPIDKVY